MRITEELRRILREEVLQGQWVGGVAHVLYVLVSNESHEELQEFEPLHALPGLDARIHLNSTLVRSYCRFNYLLLIFVTDRGAGDKVTIRVFALEILIDDVKKFADVGETSLVDAWIDGALRLSVSVDLLDFRHTLGQYHFAFVKLILVFDEPIDFPKEEVMIKQALVHDFLIVLFPVLENTELFFEDWDLNFLVFCYFAKMLDWLFSRIDNQRLQNEVARSVGCESILLTHQQRMLARWQKHRNDEDLGAGLRLELFQG